MAVSESTPGEDTPTLPAIFLAFSGMAVLGFGGVLPWRGGCWSKQRQWLTAEEFTEVLSLGQFLPGGNIVNVSIVVGQRFRGPRGVACGARRIARRADRHRDPARLRSISPTGRVPRAPCADGVTAAAAGLILSMAAKMATPLFRRGAGVGLAFAALTFAAVALFGFPLPLVLLVVAPVAVGLSWRRLHERGRRAIWALASIFALLSFFAIGGANAVIPEMHRQAVDVHGWMTSQRFTDLFAIAQAAPGPNIIIVTLIGWEVAGIAGAAASRPLR